MDVAEQEALVDSYHTARDIRRDRWWYRQQKAELEAAYKEFDEAVDEVFGKSEDEDEVASSAAPRRHDHEFGRPKAPPATRKSRAWEVAGARVPGRPPLLSSR